MHRQHRPKARPFSGANMFANPLPFLFDGSLHSAPSHCSDACTAHERFAALKLLAQIQSMGHGEVNEVCVTCDKLPEPLSW